tara:strand:+ start:2957 stop:3820 length:864 start_codon:yes stop_codon:yes gene_type:complete
MNINLLQRKGFALVSSWEFTLGCLLLIFILNCLFVVAYSEYASFILCILTFRSLHHRQGHVVFINNMFILLAMASYLLYLAMANYASVSSKSYFEEIYDDLSQANAAAVHLSNEGFGVYDESVSSYSLIKIGNMVDHLDNDGYIANKDIEEYRQLQRILIDKIISVKAMITSFYESQASNVQTFVHYYEREEEKSIFSIDNSILMKTNVTSDVGVVYMLDKYFEEVKPVVKVRRASYEFKNPDVRVDLLGAKTLFIVAIMLLLIFASSINFYRTKPFERNYLLGNKN